MFCRVLQLETGDMIIGMVENEDVDYTSYTMSVQDPVKLEAVRMQSGGLLYESYVLKTWLPMTDVEIIHIQTSKIVFQVSLKEKYEEQYKLYIQARELGKVDREVDQPPEEDTAFNPFARPQTNTNDIIDDLFENSDEDEYDDDTQGTSSRTLH